MDTLAAAARLDGFGRRLRRSYEEPPCIDPVLHELAHRRANPATVPEQVPLTLEGAGTARAAGRDIAFVRVDVADREVPTWCQPLLESHEVERVDLHAQVRQGVLRFCFRYTTEPGLSHLVELGPSVQTDDGRTFGTAPAPGGVTRLRVLQSDEGGRFLTAVADYRIIELPEQADDTRLDPTGPDGVWLGLSEVEALARLPATFTNEARSLVSLLPARPDESLDGSSFSILLPTHARADVLGLAIRSALVQTMPDFELLVVCDGCDEATREVLDDDRLQVFDLPKAPGFGWANRNTVLRQADGDLIANLADDDLWLPDHLERLMDAFDSESVEWAYSRPLWMADDGVAVPATVDLRRPDHLASFMEVGNSIPAPCIVHRRSALERYGYWPDRLWRGEPLSTVDWELWRNMLRPSGGRNLALIPEPTAIHFRASWRDADRWGLPVWSESGCGAEGRDDVVAGRARGGHDRRGHPAGGGMAGAGGGPRRLDRASQGGHEARPRRLGRGGRWPPSASRRDHRAGAQLGTRGRPAVWRIRDGRSASATWRTHSDEDSSWGRHAEAARVTALNATMLTSRSWRLMAPARTAGQLLRRAGVRVTSRAP